MTIPTGAGCLALYLVARYAAIARRMARLPSSAATSPRLRPLWRLDTESRLDTGDQESPGEAEEMWIREV